MNGNRSIPDKFYNEVTAMPEYRYGVTRIRVTLDDGLRFNDVFVAWGNEIVKVGIGERIPFDPAKIVAVEQQ